MLIPTARLIWAQVGQTPIICYRYDPARISVIVIWDGAQIPNRNDLRLHLETLPAYAPERNPIEADWHAVKQPLANGQPEDILQLGRTLLCSLRKARASQRVLRGCVTQSDLPPFLSRVLH